MITFPALSEVEGSPLLHSFTTALHTSTEKSSSVPIKLSGEYSKRTSPPSRYLSRYCFTHFVPCTARSRTAPRSILNTTRRCSSEVELYKCISARLEPTSDSHVFCIKCS